ncbi:MAG: hypothetical protein WDN02_06930 [Methylovirgula sp.]|uniref:hypothetical protein n=1 Tax=Methylovirgula sp. TaxID=1978224 RepID=UPI0030764038
MSVAADVGTLASNGTVTKIAKALEYGSQINFAAAYQAFKTADLAGEIQTGDDLLKVIGVFIPPVAIAANDLGAAIAGYEILLNLSKDLHLNAGSLADNAGERQGQIIADRFGR